MQKTGCTHIAKLLSETCGGRQIGKHNWLQNYNQNKQIIGSIRNPWDWYVSLWAYGCKNRGGLNKQLTERHIDEFFRKSIQKIRYANGLKCPYYSWFDLATILNNNFLLKKTNKWKEVYSDYNNKTLFRKWLKLLYTRQGKISVGEGYFSSSISKFAGFMTYRYCKLYERNFFKKSNFKHIDNYKQLKQFDRKNNLLDFTIKLENLEKDFVKVMEITKNILSPQMKDKIINSGKTNVSKHKDFSYYYDKETSDIVNNLEKLIIEKYGYKPLSTKSN